MQEFWHSVSEWILANREIVAAVTIALIVVLPFAVLRGIAGARFRGRMRRTVTLDTGPGQESKTYGVREQTIPKRGAHRRPSKDYVTPSDVASLAILPFELRTGDDLTEKDIADFDVELRQLLMQTPQLNVKVISYHRGAEATAGDRVPISTEFVLEGSISIFKAGHRPAVHVVMQIIDVAMGQPIFVDTFEGPLRALPGLMDEIVESILGALGGMLESPPLPDPTDGPSRSRTAMSFHARAEEILAQGLSRQRLDEAVRLLEHTCRIDPRFTSAKRFLVSALALRVLTLTSPDAKNDLARMEKLADALESVDQRSARLSTCLGLHQMAAGQIKLAKKHFKDALTIEANADDAMIFLAWAQLLCGDKSDQVSRLTAYLEASESITRSVLARYVLALNFAQIGDYQAAGEIAANGTEVFRPFHMNWLMMGLAQALQGKSEAAADTFFRSRRVMKYCDDAAVSAWVDQSAVSKDRLKKWRKAFENTWRV